MSRFNRQKQKELTKKQLIEAAFYQFAQDGLLAAKTSDIAASAGVAHGTLFVHFPTRKDLLVSVIQEFGGKIAGRIHELASKSSSVREVLVAHLNGIKEYESFYCRLVNEGALLPTEARNALIMIQSAISFHLSQVVEREIEASKIRRVSLHLLFNTWIGLIHYYLANADLFSAGGSVLAKYGEELLDHYMGLINV